ncbi:hypothetical protein ACOXXX_21565 [Thalassococcus sp. BH17M4-6]|uniref:hypothetical protein n=1 Tax=Thalassococcus sp. BH17M4-6 TaxID=3413148 RepID=UPI003BDAA5EF
MSTNSSLQSYVFSGLDGTLLVKRAIPSDSISVCSTAMLNVRGGQSIKVPGTGALAHHPNAHLSPTSEPYRHWRNDSSVFFCDVVTSQESDHPICLRKKLRCLEKMLQSRGVTVRFGIEIEFTAAPKISHGPALHAPQLMSDLGMHRSSSFLAEEALDRILKKGEYVGIKWYSAGREFFPNQFEVSLGPMTATELAEQFLLAKEVITSEFSRVGWSTSFMPLPNNGSVGNGCHINVSLEKNHASTIKAGGVASSLASDIKRYTGFFNPSVNSFRRLDLDDFRGMQDLGDHRHCMIRVLEKDNARLELRTPDAMMNVYAALLAVLFSVNRAIFEVNDADEESFLFPDNLTTCITRLKKLTKFKSCLGDVFYDAFVDMLEHQDKFYKKTVSPVDFLLLEPRNILTENQ